MNEKDFKCKKPNAKYAVNSIKNSLFYNPGYFGMPKYKGNGLGVKICIIDTGIPNSTYIKTPLSKAVDFTNTKIMDNHGHSTGVAGIILGNSKNNLIGIAPQSSVWYAKAIKDSGEGDHGAILASILYAIIQKVDIIVMSFGCQQVHPSLRDAVKKAYDNGIAMFAANGNRTHTKDADFPARFPEIMSTGLCEVSKKINIPNTNSPSIEFGLKNIYTTYFDNMFIKMSGSSISAPIAAGIAACVIQEARIKKENLSPADVYKKLMNYS